MATAERGEVIRREEVDADRAGVHAPGDAQGGILVRSEHDPAEAEPGDADKLWRVTPHGISIVCGWFGLTREESLRITAARVQGSLFTEPARAMAHGFAAIGSIDVAPEREGLV